MLLAPAPSQNDETFFSADHIAEITRYVTILQRHADSARAQPSAETISAVGALALLGIHPDRIVDWVGRSAFTREAWFRLVFCTLNSLTESI